MNNLRRGILVACSLFFALNISAQSVKARIQDSKFDQELQSILTFSVPIISVAEAKNITTEMTILDVREPKEYKVSHIPGALNVGYRFPNKKLLNTLDKTQPVMVYCSVGYRSEKLGEKLKMMGFQKVYNLYGSIFEWVNQGFPIEDENGEQTKVLHTYNKKWSQWVTSPMIKKTW